MKLLIVTQQVDRSDHILGFFHRWLEMFSARTERLIVLCQSLGDHATFPDHVRLCSLGKERGATRVRQVLRFWLLLWRHRREYDCVLVHMTPVWVVLGWPLWFLLRKRLYLWYEIRRGSVLLSLALLCIEKVFSATSQGLPRPSVKQVVLGHGIDADAFVPDSGKRDESLIVAAGRLTRSKQYDVILQAFAALPSMYRLEIAGTKITAHDEKELKDIESLIERLGVSGRVKISAVHYMGMPTLFQRASLLLHAGAGGLDKVVLEAMSCECLVVATSVAARSVLPERCLATPETLAEKAHGLLSLSPTDRAALGRELRRRVVEGHNLPRLVSLLVAEMQ